MYFGQLTFPSSIELIPDIESVLGLVFDQLIYNPRVATIFEQFLGESLGSDPYLLLGTIATKKIRYFKGQSPMGYPMRKACK